MSCQGTDFTLNLIPLNTFISLTKVQGPLIYLQSFWSLFTLYSLGQAETFLAIYYTSYSRVSSLAIWAAKEARIFSVGIHSLILGVSSYESY
jgi:hypothetical protein